MVEALGDRGVEVADLGPARRRRGRLEPRLRLRLAWPPSPTVARETGRLIATNEDPTHPTPDGLLPGPGALLAAVATASGVEPGGGRQAPPADGRTTSAAGFWVRRGDRAAVMVGDQPATDGRLAERLGIPFVLVDSGVTAAGSHRRRVSGGAPGRRLRVGASPRLDRPLMHPLASKVLAPS